MSFTGNKLLLQVIDLHRQKWNDCPTASWCPCVMSSQHMRRLKSNKTIIIVVIIMSDIDFHLNSIKHYNTRDLRNATFKKNHSSDILQNHHNGL